MTYPDARAAVAALASGSAGPDDLREIVGSFPELRPVVAAYPAADESLVGWLRDLHDPAVDAQLSRRSDAPAATSPLPPADPPRATAPSVARGAEPWDAVQWDRFSEVPAPVAAVQVPAAGPAEPLETDEPIVRPRRRVWPVIVAVVAGLAVIGGGVGAAWGYGLFGKPSVSPPPTHSTNPKASSSATASPPTPAATTSGPTATTSTQPTTGAAGFTCWDGRLVPALTDCGGPEGIAGMRYMFPSLDEHLATPVTFDCTQVTYPKRDKYTVSYDCPLAGETAQTGKQLVRYRYWTDAKAALKHYRGIFKVGGSSQPFYLNGTKVGTVFSSDGPLAEGNGRYAMAFVLLGGHMCLSVEGASEYLLDDMLKEARFRVPDQFRGHPGAQASETTWQR